MQKLECIGWTVGNDDDKYVYIKFELTDVTFTRVHSTHKSFRPIYGESHEIIIPFKIIPTGTITKQPAKLTMPICCYYKPSTNGSCWYVSEHGVYIDAKFSNKRYVANCKNAVYDTVVVTVYNISTNDRMSTFTVYKHQPPKVNESCNETESKSNTTPVTKETSPISVEPAPYIHTTNPVITFGKVYDDVIVPTKRREDAGLDIYAYFSDNDEFKVIPPHGTAIFNTGLVSHFSPEWYIELNERGSTGTIGIGQRAGIIDSGYRGEWMVPLTNTTDKWIIIAKGIDSKDKEGNYYARSYYADIFKVNPNDIILYPYNKAICQATVHYNYDVQIKVDTVENVKAVPSERGSGKLGSSGK